MTYSQGQFKKCWHPPAVLSQILQEDSFSGEINMFLLMYLLEVDMASSSLVLPTAAVAFTQALPTAHGYLLFLHIDHTRRILALCTHFVALARIRACLYQLIINAMSLNILISSLVSPAIY